MVGRFKGDRIIGFALENRWSLPASGTAKRHDEIPKHRPDAAVQADVDFIPDAPELARKQKANGPADVFPHAAAKLRIGFIEGEGKVGNGRFARPRQDPL
jgi:hypothetical protein